MVSLFRQHAVNRTNEKAHQVFETHNRFEEPFASGNRRAADQFFLECSRQKKHRRMKIARFKAFKAIVKRK
jgi:hypothetical protein